MNVKRTLVIFCNVDDINLKVFEPLYKKHYNVTEIENYRDTIDDKKKVIHEKIPMNKKSDIDVIRHILLCSDIDVVFTNWDRAKCFRRIEYLRKVYDIKVYDIVNQIL